MSQMNTKPAISITRLLPAVTLALTLLLSATAHAAAPGIQGSTFNLQARAAFISQPDGSMVYSWGYGCVSTGGNAFVPANIAGASCPTMQLPGPTLVVTEGDSITVNLTNNLPVSAGNTSMLFPGFQVSSSGGTAGLLAQEAAPGATVTYTFTASTPGTHTYYSGTQGDLQVEMGMYGALIVLPANVPSACNGGIFAQNVAAARAHGEGDYRLAHAAYDHPGTCYDREYLFQFSEMDPRIHRQAEEQVQALGDCSAVLASACHLNVATEPYHPAYFMINGRSMPDDMDPNYAVQYPHQPYNGNPHLHPGELVLVRVIGNGRWQHPFHEHGNHLRTLARDGNLILSQSDPTKLAGPLLLTTTTTPGLTYDGIFYWTGKGLNWDVFGHNAGNNPGCTPDANGYDTSTPSATNYFEWCQDHMKALEKAPFGDVGAGGPITLPDPTILANGPWYGGSPYLGPDATGRAVGSTPIPPSGTVANDPGSEAGFAFMWHSHNERELTTNNSFPGGMMMMMLVDSREYIINESN
jgi:FtsP/CotA-like multicopper oxidase with cupredoxin domain